MNKKTVLSETEMNNLFIMSDELANWCNTVNTTKEELVHVIYDHFKFYGVEQARFERVNKAMNIIPSLQKDITYNHFIYLAMFHQYYENLKAFLWEELHISIKSDDINIWNYLNFKGMVIKEKPHIFMVVDENGNTWEDPSKFNGTILAFIK